MLDKANATPERGGQKQLSKKTIVIIIVAILVVIGIAVAVIAGMQGGVQSPSGNDPAHVGPSDPGNNGPSDPGNSTDPGQSDPGNNGPSDPGQTEDPAIHSPWSVEANHDWSGKVYKQDNVNKGLLAQTSVKVWDPMPTKDMKGYFLFPGSTTKVEVGENDYIIPILVSITAFDSVDVNPGANVIQGQYLPTDYWIRDGKPSEISPTTPVRLGTAVPYTPTEVMIYLVVSKSAVKNGPIYKIQPNASLVGTDSVTIVYNDGKIELQ